MNTHGNYVCDIFPKADSVKTYKGAVKRIERFLERINDAEETIRYAIHVREDGTFVPVAMLTEKQFGAGFHFAAMDCKVCAQINR